MDIARTSSRLSARGNVKVAGVYCAAHRQRIQIWCVVTRLHGVRVRRVQVKYGARVNEPAEEVSLMHHLQGRASETYLEELVTRRVSLVKITGGKHGSSVHVV